MKALTPLLLVVLAGGLVFADDIPGDCPIQPFSVSATGTDTEVTATSAAVAVTKILSGSLILSEPLPANDRTLSLIVEQDSTLTVEYSSTGINRTFDISIPLGITELTPADLPLVVPVAAEFCACGGNTDLWGLVGTVTLSLTPDHRLRLDFSTGLQPANPPCQCESPVFNNTQANVPPFVVEAAIPEGAIVCDSIPTVSSLALVVSALLLMASLAVVLWRRPLKV